MAKSKTKKAKSKKPLIKSRQKKVKPKQREKATLVKGSNITLTPCPDCKKKPSNVNQAINDFGLRYAGTRRQSYCYDCRTKDARSKREQKSKLGKKPNATSDWRQTAVRISLGKFKPKKKATKKKVVKAKRKQKSKATKKTSKK